MNDYLADLLRDGFLRIVIAAYCDKYGITGSVCLHTLPAIVRFDKALNGASDDAYWRIYTRNLSNH